MDIQSGGRSPTFWKGMWYLGVGGCWCFYQWCLDAVGDRGSLWLKCLSFRGLCCQVDVTPHAQWGLWGRGTTVGKCGGFWDTVEPCLCRDGKRSMGLMGWWWETKMSGNRQPFRVGPVREAYWEPSSPQLPGLAWGGEPGGGKNRKKEGGPSNRVLTHHPNTRLLFWSGTWAGGLCLNRSYSMCPCRMLWSITSLCYPSKKQLHNCAHMCVMPVGREEKATNLAGFFVWRA